MDVVNEQVYWFQTLPYRLGILLAGGGAIGSTLLVFNKPVAEYYAVSFAGKDMEKEFKELDVDSMSELTTNEVGTWTWSWMEPMIGTASFVLLCMQFMRAQSVKMNMRPYTEAMLNWRAKRLAGKFPQYEGGMVRMWAVNLPKTQWNFMPVYRRQYYTPEMRKRNTLRGTGGTGYTH
eukprot:gnl/MRDRNA2_/MRDRNA2_62509_c0_seq1.p1 gnl/MRDRNA2_/MRDRNA2_62509_c0~~gnl/MRDRNA2_/MRDRNA2_62509_c0_seq1.p1  ORF type:complete len:177 (+),score=8.42 gnl/MRDRNA2_/MRDRNA2_62509_c0_seq1:164-694(+)